MEMVEVKMDFGDAIKAIKDGKYVKRADWGGYWFLPVAIQLSNYTSGLEGKVPDDVFMNDTIVACLKGDEGFAPATPYMADMLADDWEIAVFENGKLVN